MHASPTWSVRPRRVITSFEKARLYPTYRILPNIRARELPERGILRLSPSARDCQRQTGRRCFSTSDERLTNPSCAPHAPDCRTGDNRPISVFILSSLRSPTCTRGRAIRACSQLTELAITAGTLGCFLAPPIGLESHTWRMLAVARWPPCARAR